VREGERPPLSVVIPAREGIRELDAVLAELLPQAREAAAEVIVSGGVAGVAPDGVRLLPSAETSILGLRLAGVRAAEGELVAIGEDHAVPMPGCIAGIIDAHREHPTRTR
jgi:hypothetical protein